MEALRRAEGAAKYGWFLEQGLGKTGVALNHYIGDQQVDLMVIVAPQSFKLGWLTALDEYDVNFLRSGYWPRDRIPFEWEQGIYSINYEAMSRENSKARIPLMKLMEQRRVLLVIDESKALGNPRSDWTKASIELAKRATQVRLLNGTPICQTPMDYYGQLRACGPFNGMLPVSFRNRFCVLRGYMGKQIMPQIRNGEELGQILDSCSFRALKKDWRADLPPKVYSTMDLELTRRQKTHYKTMLEEFYAMMGEHDVTAQMVITQLGKLRQISSGVLLDDEREFIFEPPGTNPKVQAVKELCDGPGKAIVVYYHKISGRMLMEALADFNPAYIRGGMEPEEIVEQKRRFNEDADCRIIIGQERATALGHTLIGPPGDRCNRTIFFETSWSLYYRSQVEDRSHRGDQDETVTMWDLISSPVERSVLRALQAKRDLAMAVDDIVAAIRQSLGEMR